MTINPIKKFKFKRNLNDQQENVTWRLWFYFFGSMFTQISTNAAQVIGPLILLKVSSSGFMTLIFGFSAGTDALGTLFGSLLLKRYSPNVTLVLLHIWRIVCNLLIVLFLKFNILNKINCAILILVDNFSLGMYDTVRALLPLVWTDNGNDANNSIHKQLKRLNQRAQFMFELGTLVGPLIIGFVLRGANNNHEIAVWCTIASFIGTCLCYTFVPKKISPVPESKQNFKQTMLNIVHSKDSTMKQCYLVMILLQIYRVKSSLPALVASSILNSPSSTAWITSMWGVSGMIGSMIFRNLNSNSFVSTLKIDALALLIFAIAWKTYNLYAYLLTVVFYITIDTVARLQVQTSLQAEITINSLDASIMSTNRFLSKINALIVRLIISACFYAPDINELPFWLTTAFLGLCSIVTLGLAYWCQRNRKLKAIADASVSNCLLDTTAHHYPGYLFVFEGLDGSGKSTQIMLLMEWLKEQYPNKKINLTTWNSSALLSNTIRHFKQQRFIDNPHSFALLQCADLFERLHKLIIPALNNGEIVLCDRYCFTALARDKVRGCDFDWETQLYKYQFQESNSNKSILVWPDAILLFHVPVHIAIARVYARSLVQINPKQKTPKSLNEQENFDSEIENKSDENQTDVEDDDENDMNEETNEDNDHENNEQDENEDDLTQQDDTSTMMTDDILLKQRIDTTFRGSITYDTIAGDLIRPRSSSKSDVLASGRKQQDNENSDIETIHYSTMNNLSLKESKTNDDKNVSTSIIRISYYEAGLDLCLHKDFNVNFHLFQHKVQNVYQELYKEYSFTNTFHLFNGELDKQTLFELIKQCVQTTIQKRHLQRKSIVSANETLKNLKSEVCTISDEYDSIKLINKNIFLKSPIDFHQVNKEKLFLFYRKSHDGKTPGAALHFYSRFLTLELQKRFVGLWESFTNQSIFNPNHIKSYLHGNPQLDNCLLTQGQTNGCFLLDFDRSRIGPISWDVVRLLLSIQIAFNTKSISSAENQIPMDPVNDSRAENQIENLTILPVSSPIKIKSKNFDSQTKQNNFPLSWSQAFQKGYIDGINAKEHLQTLSYSLAKLVKRKKKQFQIPNYLKSSRSQPISLEEIQNEQSNSHYIFHLLNQYLKSSSAEQAGLTSDLIQMTIIEIGRTYSTQQRERIIVVIEHENKYFDLEFKLMLHDFDQYGFFHPQSIHSFDDAQRFLLAYQFYLPEQSIHQILFPAACKGPNSSTYLAFVHQIQSVRYQIDRKMNSTFKFRLGLNVHQLDSFQIQELLYSLAHQLAFAHAKYLKSNLTQTSINMKLTNYIKRYWNQIIACVLQLQEEVIQSYQSFVTQQQFHLKKEL